MGSHWDPKWSQKSTKVLRGRHQKEVLKKAAHRHRPKGAKSMFSLSKTTVFTMARMMQKSSQNDLQMETETVTIEQNGLPQTNTKNCQTIMSQKCRKLLQKD